MAHKNDELGKVRSALLERTWFGFDLDDTLHEFRKASGAAVQSTLSKISLEYRISMDDLQHAHKQVLAQKTALAFTDGRTSDDYRKERFTAVLGAFSVEATPKFLDELAATYKKSLGHSLELKAGAMSLIAYLKSIGKKIVIITEGPQDAQEWTLSKLGLIDMVDYLATTNFFGVSKVDGLFQSVLGQLGIGSGQLVYVGDSWERDMLPALACGIYCVHYAEKEGSSMDGRALKIKALTELEEILRT